MKKVLAIILAALMLVACFAGCNQDTDEPVVDAPVVDASGTDAPVDTPTELPNVSLVLTGSELAEPQAALRAMADAFIAEYADEANITIEIGAMSEATAKDTVIADIEAAPDVFYFADDQTAALVNAGALQPVYDVELVQNANGGAQSGSVLAATINDTLYAYPATASNGYFVWYNTKYLTEADCATMDGMLAKALELGKFISMETKNGWYSYSFFKGAGFTMTLSEDGVTNICDWNAEGGVEVLESMLAIVNSGAFKSIANGDIGAYLADDSVIAFIGGDWNLATVTENWGEDYGCCKLPTYTYKGEQIQMGSFAGYKLVGVNPYSEDLYYAMELAKWVTNEENQVYFFEQTGFGPSNVNAAKNEAVLANRVTAALSAQSAYAVVQSVGGNYWGPAETMFDIIANGNAENMDLQTLLDDTVASIIA